MTKIKTKARELFEQYHALKERRVKGDLDAADTLMELNLAMEKAGLTALQHRIIGLVHIFDEKQIHAAATLRIPLSTLSYNLIKAEDLISDKLAEISSEDYGNSGKRILKVRALTDASVEPGERVRIPVVVFGSIPKGSAVELFPYHVLACWTNLTIGDELLSDGTLEIRNEERGDFWDCVTGLADGSYIVHEYNEDGTLLRKQKWSASAFMYNLPDVPYEIKKGDVLAKVEVAA